MRGDQWYSLAAVGDQVAASERSSDAWRHWRNYCENGATTTRRFQRATAQRSYSSSMAGPWGPRGQVALVLWSRGFTSAAARLH